MARGDGPEAHRTVEYQGAADERDTEGRNVTRGVPSPVGVADNNPVIAGRPLERRAIHGVAFTASARPTVPIDTALLVSVEPFRMVTDDIDGLLRELEAADQKQRAEGLDRSERWRSVPRETGQFLYQLTMVRRPDRIVEIGTSHGYSTLWLGLAADRLGAEVVTYEVEAWRHDQAVENVARTGLEETVTAELVDPDFGDYPDGIGLAFVDAEKEDYVDHLRHLEPRLDAGAVVVADNVESHAETLAGYVDYVRGHPDFFSVLVPVGKGLEVTRQVDPAEADAIDALR